MEALAETQLLLLRQLAFSERVSMTDLSRALAETGQTLREMMRLLEEQGQDLQLAEQNRRQSSRKPAAARRREAAKKADD
jgi:hypothetical protein